MIWHLDTREKIASMAFLVMSGPLYMGILWYYGTFRALQLPAVASVVAIWLVAFPWVAGWLMTDNSLVEP